MRLPLVVVPLTLAALAAGAQDGPPRGGPGGGQPGDGPPPPPPIIAALDADRDGVIDAREIDNAPAALRTLDKNGDGKLTRDELRPPRPGGQGGPGGPRGQSRPSEAGGERPAPER